MQQLYSLCWSNWMLLDDVCRVVMVISYYHGDFGVHIDNSMNMTGFLLSE